ncbi:MAG: serine hydrolase [Bacillota bacterium]
MGFDRNLPLKDRLKKRRRQKRARQYFMMAVILVIGLAFIVYSSGAKTDDKDTNAALMRENSEDYIITEPEEDVSFPASNGSDTVEIEDPDTDDVVNVGDENEIDTSVPAAEETLAQENKIDYSALRSELESYISKYKGQYGIYYIDLTGNDEFGINAEGEYKAASTFKLPLNLYMYKRIKEGKVNPEGTLKYTRADYEDGAGIIRYKDYGQTYTIRELCRLSVVYSDNVAVNMLLRFVGKQNVKNYMREMGGKVVADNKNITSPKDMALYLKKLYEFYQNEGQLGKEMMNNFINTEFRDRLPKLLPEDLKIAHKTGNLIGIVHDIGIVFTDKPYVIVVMSKDVVSDQEANDVIANISKKVYDYVKDR